MKNGQYVDIRCGALAGACRHRIAQIETGENGIVVRDHERSFDIKVPWYFLQGCPNHTPAETLATKDVEYRRSVPIPWEALADAYERALQSSRVEPVTFHPDDFAAFRAQYGAAAHWE